MNIELQKSSIKGKEEITLTIWPEGNLETEFFNQLFSGEVGFENVAGNGNQIVIKKKPNSSPITTEP